MTGRMRMRRQLAEALYVDKDWLCRVMAQRGIRAGDGRSWAGATSATTRGYIRRWYFSPIQFDNAGWRRSTNLPLDGRATHFRFQATSRQEFPVLRIENPGEMIFNGG